MTTESGMTSPGRVRPVRAVIGALLRAVPGLRPAVEKLLWRGFYELASLRGNEVGTTLMNYGYAPQGEDPDAEVTESTCSGSGGSDQERYGRALYGAVAGAGELRGRQVLEVGCGRGGGSAHVFERFSPRSMCGVDLARTGIERARRRYGRPGLTFMTGDAQSLPFPTATFDAVVNVESSHCYPDMNAFLAEAYRVLRPGGLLLIADFRPTDTAGEGGGKDDVAALRRQLDDAGLRTLEEEDITAAVVRALSLATPTVRARVQRGVPRPLRRYALEFSAVEGSTMFRSFAEGRLTYLRLALQKD